MMKYTDVKKPSWSDVSHNKIDCMVKFEIFDEYIPFTASKDDVEDWGKKIYEECKSLKWGGEVKKFTPPIVDEKALAETRRNSLLDEAQNRIVVWQTKLLAGRVIKKEEKTQLNEWIDYIDLLYAINTEDEINIEWPSKPKE